jgi:type IV pilus biogenesis protein CpaD/CtpE
MTHRTVLIVLLTLVLSACSLAEIDANPNPDFKRYRPSEFAEITVAARDGTLTDAQREVWCGLLEYYSTDSNASIEAFFRDNGMTVAEEGDLLRGARQHWIDTAEEDGCDWATLLSSKDN